MVVFAVDTANAVLFRGSKNERPISPISHYVSCVRVWATWADVAGSAPTCGIFSENVCECVIVYHVMRLHIRHRQIFHLLGPNLGRFPNSQVV